MTTQGKPRPRLRRSLDNTRPQSESAWGTTQVVGTDKRFLGSRIACIYLLGGDWFEYGQLRLL
jgi:hypothetical protein